MINDAGIKFRQLQTLKLTHLSPWLQAAKQPWNLSSSALQQRPQFGTRGTEGRWWSVSHIDMSWSLWDYKEVTSSFSWSETMAHCWVEFPHRTCLDASNHWRVLWPGEQMRSQQTSCLPETEPCSPARAQFELNRRTGHTPSQAQWWCAWTWTVERFVWVIEMKLTVLWLCKPVPSDCALQALSFQKYVMRRSASWIQVQVYDTHWDVMQWP